MADYTEPSAVAPGARSSLRYLEIPAVMLALLAGAAFLTKMCYLSLAFNTIFVHRLSRIVLLIRPPSSQHSDSFDTPGARLPRTPGRCTRKLLPHVWPAVWTNAVRRVLTHDGAGARQPDLSFGSPGVCCNSWGLDCRCKLTAFFAATIVFSLSAIYEIIELWDEIYFGGQRIWGPYDYRHRSSVGPLRNNCRDTVFLYHAARHP